MNTDTYYIPVNFTNAGRILGLFEIRNLIEALLLCLPVLYVCLTYLPFSLTPKIIVTVSLVVPIGGVVITKDNRFIKILEIVPVNIYLKSAEDRQAIVEAFAAYLKIAPDHMQFEARTLPADISRYVERMQEYAKNEDNAYCRDMIQDNIQDIGMGVASNALQHRFFMVFQYESQMRASPNTVQGIIQRLNEEADTARRYLDLCELEVQEPRYADDFALELLYEIINKRTSQRVKLPEGVFDMTTAVHGVYEAQTQ